MSTVKEILFLTRNVVKNLKDQYEAQITLLEEEKSAEISRLEETVRKLEEENSLLKSLQDEDEDLRMRQNPADQMPNAARFEPTRRPSP